MQGIQLFTGIEIRGEWKGGFKIPGKLKHGKQTLKILKSRQEFSHIPVAIVTTSSSQLDVDVCKRLGATIFLTKPDTYAQWQEVIRQLEHHIGIN